MATSIVYSSTTTSGKSLSKSITDVNPDISNATAKEFVNKLNALTTNTVDTISRVDKTDIPADANYYDVAFSIDIEPTTSSATVDGNSVTIPLTALPDTTDISDMISVIITPKVNNIAFMPPNITMAGNIGPDGALTCMDSTTVMVVLAKPTNAGEIAENQTLTITVPAGQFTSGNNTYHYNTATLTITATV